MAASRQIGATFYFAREALIDAITTWIEHRNLDPKPFIWHAAADDIIKKVQRGRESLAQVKRFTEH